MGRLEASDNLTDRLQGLLETLRSRKTIHHAVLAVESDNRAVRWFGAVGDVRPDGLPMRPDTPYAWATDIRNERCSRIDGVAKVPLSGLWQSSDSGRIKRWTGCTRLPKQSIPDVSLCAIIGEPPREENKDAESDSAKGYCQPLHDLCMTPPA